MTMDDLVTIAPLAAAVLVACAVLLVDLAWPGRGRPAIATALIGLTIVVALIVSIGSGDERTAFGGSYTLDPLTTFLDLLFVAIVAMTILFAPDYLAPRGLPIAEFSTVLIFALSRLWPSGETSYCWARAKVTLVP